MKGGITSIQEPVVRCFFLGGGRDPGMGLFSVTKRNFNTTFSTFHIYFNFDVNLLYFLNHDNLFFLSTAVEQAVACIVCHAESPSSIPGSDKFPVEVFYGVRSWNGVI